MKPADGKPAYGGRGFYPGQSVKHGSDHRTSGLVPSKGPPASNPYRTSHQHPRPLPHLNLDSPVSHIVNSTGIYLFFLKNGCNHKLCCFIIIFDKNNPSKLLVSTKLNNKVLNYLYLFDDY